MTWFDRLKTDVSTDAESQKELELKPEDFKKQLDSFDTKLETKFSDVDKKLSKVDDIAAYVAEQRQARLDAERKEADKQRREQQNVGEEDWLTDPKLAFEKSISPLVASNIHTASMVIRQQVLADDPSKEFYHGDFKRDVDALIDNLPLVQKADPSTIANCYDLVMGRKHKEIAEGKIKSKFAQVSSSGDGTGGPNGTKKDEVERQLTAQEKKVADVFGLTPTEYLKNSREVSYL